MEPLMITTAEEAEEFIRNSNTRNVKVGVFDMDGSGEIDFEEWAFAMWNYW